MLVRMLTGLLRGNRLTKKGGVVDLPVDEARRYIESRQAVAVESDEPLREAATVAPPQNAMRRHEPERRDPAFKRR